MHLEYPKFIDRQLEIYQIRFPGVFKKLTPFKTEQALIQVRSFQIFCLTSAVSQKKINNKYVVHFRKISNGKQFIFEIINP